MLDLALLFDDFCQCYTDLGLAQSTCNQAELQQRTNALDRIDENICRQKTRSTWR